MTQFRTRAIASAGFLLLFALMVVGIRQTFTLGTVAGNDFYPRFRGAMLFWREGIDPYSEDATAIIQEAMYGRPALPEEDQVLFVYPFYTVFLLLPFVWLPLDYSWIQAIWMTILMFALLGGVFIIRDLLEWKLSPLLLAVLALWTVTFYYSTRVIILGQFAGLVFLLLMATLLALQRQRDVWAGFFLAWTTIKPQMVVFLIPALLLWAMWRQRWRFAGSFIAAAGLLLAASFMLLPGWFTAFIEQLVTYPEYTAYASSPLKWLSGLAPWLGVIGRRAMQLLLVAWMLWEWRRLQTILDVSTELFMILGVTTITSVLIFDQTATTNQILLYLPLLLGFHALARSLKRYSYLVILSFLGLIVGTWVLFLLSIQGNQEHPVMYWPLPLVVAIILTMGRSFVLRHAAKDRHDRRAQTWARA